MEKIRLTQTVQKGGCAAKVAASELRQILGRVRFPPAHPELMVDGGLFDDAAIYKISEELAMVQTLDFFTPIVDSPRRFGAIAAANALSDVYAMGGRPKTAMAILAFPLATMSSDVIVEVLQGASDKIEEAGANFVGGHSIDDDTLKFGLSVTGLVNPARVWSNAGAREGDDLILTKALGTGAITAALKRGEVTEDGIVEALDSMATLNRAIDFLSSASQAAVHAATDVTGFGLTGHSYQMAHASRVSFRLEAGAIPVLPRAPEFLEKGFLTKAHRSNAQYTGDHVEWMGASDIQKLLFNDPQTSGGLLLSVDPSATAAILQQLKTAFPKTARIGRVEKAGAKALAIGG